MSLLAIIVVLETLTIIVGLFKLSKPNYDGAMVVTDTAEKKTFSLEITTDPDKLDQKKQIVLEVKTSLE